MADFAFKRFSISSMVLTSLIHFVMIDWLCPSRHSIKRMTIAPGIGYGEYGKGYARIALTVGEKRLKEAMGRLKTLNL